jgi:Tol biopolymer transport system component
MRFPTRYIPAIVVGGVLLTGIAVSQKNNTPEAMLRAAMDKETVDGDLKAAIEQYKKVIAQKGASNDVVANALVRLGGAYEKQASAEARPVYERVVREFSGQTDAAQEARSRLAMTPSNSAEISLRRICSGADCDGVISPNGRNVINDFGNPIVRDLVTGQSHPLTNVPDGYIGRAPKWAPDSKRVAFTESSLAEPRGEQIVVANLDGGMSRTIFHGERALAFAWSPDGNRILVGEYGKGSTTNLLWIGAADGKLENLTDRLFVMGASISLDGRYIAYGASKNVNSTDGTDLYVMASDGTAGAAIVASPNSGLRLPVGWTPDGKHLLFVENSNSRQTDQMSLWAVPFDSGKPGVPILVHRDSENESRQYLGMTRSGAVFYRIQARLADTSIVSMNPETGKVTSPPTPLPQLRTGGGIVSPDGLRILHQTTVGSVVEPTPDVTGLSIYSIDSGKDQRVASSIVVLRRGVCWSADGASILFNRPLGVNATQSEPVRFNLNTGEATPLFPGASSFTIRTCSAELVVDFDSTAIKVRSLKTGSETEIHKYSRRQLLQSSPFISHDGRWVAFREVLVDGSAALYVVSSEGGPAKELVRVKSPATFINPRGLGWSPDDRFIFFLRRPDDNSPSELFRVPVSGGSEESTGLKGPGLGAAEIAPDGKRIVIGAINQQTEIWAMENFLPSPAAKK